jgi:hypothetical protein
MQKRAFLGPIVLLLALSFMGLRLGIEHIPRPRVPGAGIIYVPSGKYLKMATFGYSSLFADVLYIWAIQYYGDTTIPERFDYLFHIFSVISELDPRYVDPYEVGAMIALFDARDPSLSLKILDMGLAKNPDMWIFPLDAGHYAQLYLKDFGLAREYYKKAMDIPGAPAITRRLFADSSFKVMDLETAWETWLEVYNSAKDPQIRKIASNHLYQVKAAADIQALKGALAKYREEFGRLPLELGQLVRAGLLPQIPKDLDGKDYLYDSKTGNITTAVVPWKR